MAVSNNGTPKKKGPSALDDDMETISDQENDDDDDEVGGEEGAEEGAEGGLTERYKKALADSGGPSNDDHSFTRYIRASQMGM